MSYKTWIKVNKRYLECFANGVVALVAGLTVAWIFLCLSWQDWVIQVYLASQKGNTIEDVKHILGTDYTGVSIASMLRDCPQCEEPKQKSSVIVSTHVHWILSSTKLPLQGWRAYIVFDAQGKVVASRMCPFRD